MLYSFILTLIFSKGLISQKGKEEFSQKGKGESKGVKRFIYIYFSKGGLRGNKQNKGLFIVIYLELVLKNIF